MLGLVFVFLLFAVSCIGGLFRPHIGLIGYYGFALLQPQWNWRWSLPPDFPFQKYIAGATIIGFFICGRRNRLAGATLNACLALGLFLALAFLSAQFTIGPARTQFYMSVMWKLVVMAILAVLILDTPQKLVWMMWILILAQGYNAYQINLQYFQDGVSRYAQGGWGFQGDNNGYSNVTIPIMAISASLVVFSDRTWKKTIAAAILLLQAHQIMLLESRGAMLGALAALVAFFVLVPRRQLPVKWVVAIVVATSALAGPPVVREFRSIMVERDELDDSAASRFELWDAGMRITAAHPWLGVGPDAGRFLVPMHLPRESSRSDKALHNLLFELTTGVGIPATVLYLAFFGIPCWLGVRRLGKRRIDEGPKWSTCAALASTSGLVGYWVASMFSSGALFESSYICASVGLAAVAIHYSTSDQAQPAWGSPQTYTLSSHIA